MAESRGPVYLPDFVAGEAAARLLAALEQDVPWSRERLSLFGRQVAVPRQVAWCGDAGLCYRYSGSDHHCSGWLPPLRELRDRLAREHGLEYNMVLLNRYRAGTDYMGWHRDDERGLAARVASVSLGATRRFLLRPAGRGRSQPLDLEAGSLLLFDADVPHSLPRTRRPVGLRVNLTFRQLGLS